MVFSGATGVLFKYFGAEANPGLSGTYEYHSETSE
jgi:hypothetical protein